MLEPHSKSTKSCPYNLIDTPTGVSNKSWCRKLLHCLLHNISALLLLFSVTT